MSINFFRGHPSVSLLPNETIVKATTSLLSNPRDYDLDNDNRHPLSYGSDPGAKWVREEISDFINKSFKLEGKATSKADDFNLTGGASYGIMNILTQTTLAHTGFTKQAFIITPTYYLLNDTFIDAGFNGKITAIDELENSIDLKQLETKLRFFNEQSESNPKDLELITSPKSSIPKKIYKFVLYLVPTFSNPGGESYDLKTKLKLIELAREYDMLIISDDVYDFLDYTQPLDVLPTPSPRLTHLDRQTYTSEYGNTISNATFSKLIAPGLRFGYQESVNPKLAFQLSQGGANVSGGSPAQLNSMIVGTIIKEGLLEGVINSLRVEYSKRAKVTKAAIEKYLPQGTKAHGFEGGYFIWVTLPDDYDSSKIAKELKNQYDVILAGGENFEVTGDLRGWGKSSVRLSVSYLSVEEIEDGIKKWGAVIEQLYPLK